tara:strand:- start:459 stop:605 length:147 start_codon:yes stop_codon:yes gene_type:complete
MISKESIIILSISNQNNELAKTCPGVSSHDGWCDFEEAGISWNLWEAD